MHDTMRGIVKTKPDNDAEFQNDLPVPACGPDDVLVRVKATAICGTDLQIMHWSKYAEDRMTLPTVFGHEFAGDIVRVGENISKYRVGDRISGETHIPCNHCIQCATNNRHICENMKIIGIHTPGSFAEYISIPQDCVYKLPDSVDYRNGAMLEPMGVAVHGVSEAGVNGKNVVICGCGPIGLLAVGVARAWRAKTIVATDMFDSKLEVAKKMGADVTVNTKKVQLKNVISEIMRGGADVVIDYTGSKYAIRDAFGALRKGGTFVMVGLPSKPFELDFSECIIYKEAVVKGVTGRRMYETWEECIEILSSESFSLEPVIGGEYKLEDYKQAFDALYSGAVGKMLLIP